MTPRALLHLRAPQGVLALRHLMASRHSRAARRLSAVRRPWAFVHRSGRRPDDGSAVVEFVTLGVLLLVPLVYLVFTLGRIQAASYAVDGGARAAARAYTSAPDDPTGRARALAAVRLALLDHGFDSDPAAATTISCSTTPCLTAQAWVTVQVRVDVVLPGIPAFVDRFASTHLTVRSEQLAVVDAFAGSAPAP